MEKYQNTYNELYQSLEFNETFFKVKIDPAANVIITASSNSTLAVILNELRNSVWENHFSRFFIIDKSSKNTCYDANNILMTVWSYKILNVVYLCRNLKNQLFFYTFNPYSNLSTKFWNLVASNSVIERWALFKHYFKPSTSTSNAFGKLKFMCYVIILRYYS